MQPLATQKNHAISRDKKSRNHSGLKKNHATCWDKKNHGTSQDKNHTTSQDKKKSGNLSGQKEIMQPLGI